MDLQFQCTNSLSQVHRVRDDGSGAVLDGGAEELMRNVSTFELVTSDVSLDLARKRDAIGDQSSRFLPQSLVFPRPGLAQPTHDPITVGWHAQRGVTVQVEARRHAKMGVPPGGNRPAGRRVGKIERGQ